MDGLLSTKMNSFGDFYDIPLIDRIKNACIEFQRETELMHPERFYYRSHKNGKLTKSSAVSEDKVVTGLVASATSVEESGDITFNFQQKIQPWSSLNIINDDAKETITGSSNVRTGIQSIDKKSGKQNLIVIASLLDKIPNLGGLARTCEIFGASKLIIGNKNVTNNKLFQSVSVTAEKWIDIDEIIPNELYQYLCKMQEKGYSIIGVEQTSQSTSLENYTFPTKTILLLGREKTGIPSQFIHMLDHCVEIPQLGLIRSLNVHVSAAIMVWEFTRQQILSGATKKE
jgi:tRNA G18 (ribose-2'-O)-methylase SpoU